MIIAFEGIDGSGKDSVIQKLIERLAGVGKTAKSFYIVGGSDLSDKIRDIMFDTNNVMSDSSRELLYTVIRKEVFDAANLYRQENPDHVIIFNRTVLSSLVYQGMCSNDDISLRRISDLYGISTDYKEVKHVATDMSMVFYLRISVETSRKRDPIGCDYDKNNIERLRNAVGFYDDIFYRRIPTFRYSDGYLKKFISRTRFIPIDAEQELDVVVDDILKHLKHVRFTDETYLWK